MMRIENSTISGGKPLVCTQVASSVGICDSASAEFKRSAQISTMKIMPQEWAVP